jgi:hypothetical protein
MYHLIYILGDEGYWKENDRDRNISRRLKNIGSIEMNVKKKISIKFSNINDKSGWPSGLRRCVQVAIHFCGRGFESLF